MGSKVSLTSKLEGNEEHSIECWIESNAVRMGPRTRSLPWPSSPWDPSPCAASLRCYMLRTTRVEVKERHKFREGIILKRDPNTSDSTASEWTVHVVDSVYEPYPSHYRVHIMIKYLCVAEKPSISRSVTQILSGGHFTTVRQGFIPERTAV